MVQDPVLWAWLKLFSTLGGANSKTAHGHFDNF